jgi:hypothetical protein
MDKIRSQSAQVFEKEQMAARRLHFALYFVCLMAANPVSVFSQGTPLQLGPLTVNVPPGWTGQTGRNTRFVTIKIEGPE